MIDIWGIYRAIDFAVVVLVGSLGSLVIALNEKEVEVYKTDDVLKNFNQFFRCVFMYQFAIKEYLAYYVKKSGIIFLIVLSSVFVLPLNLIIFFVLCVFFIIKIIAIIFLKVFGKKEDENEKDFV